MLSQFVPDALASRMVTHGPGAALNDIAQKMPGDAILITPAGWEGLSPKRDAQAFWCHVAIVRNPTPRPDPVKTLVLEDHLSQRMSSMNARRVAGASLTLSSQVQTLHKMRQGIGRGFRHPSDACTVTIYDPRFPLSSTPAPAGSSNKQLSWLSGAVPFRFRKSLSEAQNAVAEQPSEESILLL